MFLDFLRPAFLAAAFAAAMAPGTSGAVTLSADDVGSSFDVDYSYNYFGTELSAESSWTLAAYDALNGFWDVMVTIANTGAARIVSFGFATDPTASAVSILTNDAVVDWGVGTTGSGRDNVGQFPGLFTADFCVFGGNNCSGGGNEGLTNPGTAENPQSSTLLLRIAAADTDVLDFSQFAIRYQSIPTGTGSFSFEGTPVAPIPLPAGGVLLLGALGAFAFARRRKAA